MKQLLILSGKGGTGKTTLSAAFVELSNASAFADCDVDAPNLHLVFEFKDAPHTSDYYGLPKAVIDQSRCIHCDQCKKYCRFGAVVIEKWKYDINSYACEGCSVCALVCPQAAIHMEPDIAGELELFNNENKVFSTATLKMGSGTTGLLVFNVKKQLRANAQEAPFAIIDGSPGIGCPVIASLSGANVVLVVAEPSISGIHDMKRIIKTSEAFGPDIAVCINKYDTHMEMSEEIEEYCRSANITCIGRIPFDRAVIEANNTGRTMAFVDSPAGLAIHDVYKEIMSILLNKV